MKIIKLSGISIVHYFWDVFGLEGLAKNESFIDKFTGVCVE